MLISDHRLPFTNLPTSTHVACVNGRFYRVAPSPLNHGMSWRRISLFRAIGHLIADFML